VSQLENVAAEVINGTVIIAVAARAIRDFFIYENYTLTIAVC
jgi:hypothetical protein